MTQKDLLQNKKQIIQQCDEIKDLIDETEEICDITDATKNLIDQQSKTQREFDSTGVNVKVSVNLQ